jgi:hypothetical protein
MTLLWKRMHLLIFSRGNDTKLGLVEEKAFRRRTFEGCYNFSGKALGAILVIILIA